MQTLGQEMLDMITGEVENNRPFLTILSFNYRVWNTRLTCGNSEFAVKKYGQFNER